ncbi:MAG: Ig-like domain-containing protein, partial [Cyanobacteria bacterium P01_D01_bin.156]
MPTGAGWLEQLINDLLKESYLDLELDSKGSYFEMAGVQTAARRIDYQSVIQPFNKSSLDQALSRFDELQFGGIGQYSSQMFGTVLRSTRTAQTYTGNFPNSSFIVNNGLSLAVSESASSTSIDDDAVSVSNATDFYFSLESTANLNGITFRDEDIIKFDSESQSFNLYFDGSDVGLNSSEIDGFDIISDTEILFSFNTSATIEGIVVDDSDIVLFTASELGDNTSGSWSLYLDGSDVGLGNNSEDIDGLQLLKDGSLLVSTQGGFNVPGVRGADEDLIRFTPKSWGNTSIGTWSIYTDGSDISLDSSGGENISAVAIDADENLYWSTYNSFEVPEVSGVDEDVFVFTPTTTGSNTKGTFDSDLFFDGSALGIARGDIRGLDLAIGFDNNAPVANDDSFTLDTSTTFVTEIPGILGNDSDADGDSLSVSLVEDVSNGTLLLGLNGLLAYIPDEGFSGTDRFTYIASDGIDDSALATVTFTVNTAPVANDDSFTLDTGTTFSIKAPGILSNDSDADGDSLSVSLVDDVSNGTLLLGS